MKWQSFRKQPHFRLVSTPIFKFTFVIGCCFRRTNTRGNFFLHQYDSTIISFCVWIEYSLSMMQKHSLDWTLQLDALFIFFILPWLEGNCHCHQICRLTVKINLTLSFQDGCQQVCVDIYLIQWNLTITKGQGTGELCLLWRSLVISRFFFSYFTIAGVKQIICYTEDFVIIEVRYIEVPLYETWNTRYPYWKSFH